MRIMIKGGVWKNTEDEILKAAVMKYGKNQWARVASLLTRKSAKQCKARWYEWLDPSIKKVEWTREEDEKLLHLAKIFPSQWRTIAPIVGRTAAQCMEQYERLLDQAQAQGEQIDDTDDPRKLRPGEIDPAPETKPARPDPIDMDEDEKEMLSEARARLANTKGKKAKRKAREHALNEAKRLAVLQKRRELKAAGIETRLNSGKRRKYIDYAREIPFQKVAPAGYYDVSDEQTETRRIARNPGFEPIALDKLEKKNQAEEEERMREKDKRKHQKLIKMNAPQAVMKVQQENDPTALRRRLPLALPAPQVSDHELEEIVRMGQTGAVPIGDNDVTQGLIGHYNDRPTPTPMRTPRTPASEDVIMQEARNLAKMRNAPNVWSGEEMPQLEEGTGYKGLTPKSVKTSTPSMYTPSRAVKGTPLRDTLGLNQDTMLLEDDRSEVSSVSHGSSVREEKLRAKKRKLELANQLSALPEPLQVDIQVQLPVADEDEGTETGMVEDAADVDSRVAAQRREMQDRELRMRSSVLKKKLPRPPTVSKDFVEASVVGDDAAQAVDKEFRMLVVNDLTKYPAQNKKKEKRARFHANVELEDMDEALLDEAHRLIMQEAREAESFVAPEEFAAAWEQVHNELSITSKKPVTQRGDRLDVIEKDFQYLAERVEKDSRKAEKAEAKLKVTTKGYRERAAKMRSSVSELYEQLQQTQIKLECFKRLDAVEEKTLPWRLQEVQAELTKAEELEANLQQTYKTYSEELVRLQKLLASN